MESVPLVPHRQPPRVLHRHQGVQLSHNALHMGGMALGRMMEDFDSGSCDTSSIRQLLVNKVGLDCSDGVAFVV